MSHLRFAPFFCKFVIAKRELSGASRFFVPQNGFFSRQKWVFLVGFQEKFGV